jgi:hypothetical protein
MIDKNRDLKQPDPLLMERLRLKRDIKKMVDLTEAMKARQRE